MHAEQLEAGAVRFVVGDIDAAIGDYSVKSLHSP